MEFASIALSSGRRGGPGKQAVFGAQLQSQAADFIACRRVGEGQGEIAGLRERAHQLRFEGAEVDEAVHPDSEAAGVGRGGTHQLRSNGKTAIADGGGHGAPYAFEGFAVRSEASQGCQFFGRRARIFEESNGLENRRRHAVGFGNFGEFGGLEAL